MKISIIIPVYNVALYIENCLRSVLSQTYSGELECLFIDDCGTDESMAIVERMIADYNDNLLETSGTSGQVRANKSEKAERIRFRILHHDYNRGLSAARNTGVDAATGDYIYFLDSDDELTSNCLEMLVRPVTDDTTIEIVMGNFSIHSDGYKIKRFEQPVIQKKKKLISLETVRDYYFNRHGFYVYAWNKLIRKDFLVKNKLYFKEGMKWEDYLWTFFVVKHLSHLYVVPETTYIHYKRSNSITTRASRKEKAQYMGLAYSEIAHHFTLGESGREARRFIKGFCCCYVEDYKNPMFRMASCQYLKALSGCHCTKDRILLKTTVSLSQFIVTRNILRLVATIMERIN